MNSTQAYWPVKIKGDVIVCVQPTIQQMSSYVLLEQEDWFEDEMDFVRTYVTPDMNAFDMGANHGVYALSIAKKLTTGHVWAFEPTLAPGSMLSKSIELNGFSENLTWVHAGLSDHAHDADISISINSELNSLYETTGTKERIRLEALDEFLNIQKIDLPIGFVKMDVEGEEIKVLSGGYRFFTQQSPLIMFELKHGNQVNHGLIEAVQGLGYQIYRLLPDMNILVEYDASFQDGYLLNLFACKKDRADILAKRGLLASKQAIKKLGSPPKTQFDWAKHLNSLPFATTCSASWQNYLSECPKQYLTALSACLLAYDTSLTAAHRVLLLYTANQLTEELIKKSATLHPAVGLLKLHLLHVRGYRADSVTFSQQLISSLTTLQSTLSWPFIPPSQLFFTRLPKQKTNDWLITCVREFTEYRRSFSTYFINDAIQNLLVLHDNPDVANAIEFRLLLCAKRAGMNISMPDSHPLLSAETSVNSAIWHEIVFGNPVKTPDVEISKLLLSKDSPVHILDVGASTHGKLTEPYAALMQMELAQITGFEPNKAECQKLNDIYKESKQYRYYPEFVGLGGDATFYETNWFMTGSLYKPNVAVLNKFEQLDSVVQLQAQHAVKTVSIAALADLAELDMIKIDVQGAELDVFKGAAQRLDEVLVIWTEVEFIPLYENQPLFSEIEQYLRQRGFMFHAFEGMAVRGYKPYCQQVKNKKGLRQAIWTDAIFIRNLDCIESFSTVKLKKFAAILDSVTHSYDVCYLVLQLIDKRENTHFSEVYLTQKANV